MRQDLEQLKQQLSLLEYLQRHNWSALRRAAQQELVGMCPLHQETRPSFYVNVRKNLFYCHGCGHGGDLIRFVELSQRLSFRQSIAYLQQQITATDRRDLMQSTIAYYQLQLHRYPEAIRYLVQRGIQDPALIEQLGIGYAHGGSLRRHLADRGYTLICYCRLA